MRATLTVAQMSQMSDLEKWLLLACGLSVPFSTIPLAGVNLGLFDLAVLALLAVQVLRKGTLPSLGLVYWLGAIVVAGGLVSGVWARHPELVLEQVVQWSFIFFVVVPAMFEAGTHPGGARWLVAGVTGGMYAFAGYAVYDVLSGSASYIAGRYVGFQGSPQLLAFTITSLAPYLALGASVFGRRRRLRRGIVIVVYAGLATLIGWLLLMTASRTGMLAIVIALGLVLVLKQWESMKRGFAAFLKNVAAVLTIGGVLAVGVAAIVSLVSPDVLNVVVRRITLSITGSPEVLAGRMEVYEETIRELDIATLFRGVGLANYPFTSEYSLRPHNLLLLSVWEGGVLFAGGLLGSVGLFLTRALTRMSRWWRLEPAHRDVAAAAVAGFVAFLVIAMFNTQTIHRMYWLSYGYGLGALSCAGLGR